MATENQSAGSYELVVGHVRLHEVDLPCNPLKIFDGVGTALRRWLLVVQAGIDSRYEVYPSVRTAAALVEEQVDKFFPSSCLFQTADGGSAEPAIEACLQLTSGGAFFYSAAYRSRLSAYKAFVLFFVALLELHSAMHSALGAISTFAFWVTWVLLSASYAAPFSQLGRLPLLAESVLVAAHAAFVADYLEIT